jgi:hypothetical protein
LSVEEIGSTQYQEVVYFASKVLPPSFWGWGGEFAYKLLPAGNLMCATSSLFHSLFLIFMFM